MTLPQKKIWICLMGFSLMSNLAHNHAFADETKETIKGKVTVAKEDVKRAAKNAKHSVQNTMDVVKDAED